MHQYPSDVSREEFEQIREELEGASQKEDTSKKI